MARRHAAACPRESGLVRPGARAHGAGCPLPPGADHLRAGQRLHQAEHEATAGLNVAAGEDVRWLPRRRASDLCLPGNDFWLFDNRLIRFHHFDGDGRVVEDELCDDPAVIRLCSEAFEEVWERAVPHAGYRLA